VLRPDVDDEYGALNADYVAWCSQNNEEPISKTRFSASLDERGCVTHRGPRASGSVAVSHAGRRWVTGDAR
jgi:hypothetical protein